MILPIYRSFVALVQREPIPNATIDTVGDVPVQWWIDRFDPIPHSERTNTGIWIMDVEGRMTPSIWVKTPPLCKLVERDGKKWLQTPYEPYGHDATGVYLLATRGDRGFSVVPEPAAKVPATSPEPEADPMPSNPLSVVVAVFNPDTPEAHRSFVALTPPDRIETTWAPSEIRTWPNREAAEAWLETVELSDDQPVPIGTGWLRARVAEIDLAMLRRVPSPAWLSGVRFSYRLGHAASTEATTPAPSPKAPAPATHQPLFAFAD
jgi:hypothetical protein